MEHLLEVKSLSTGFEINNQFYNAISDINLTLRRGEIMGIVGESGSGKSVFSASLLKLLPEKIAKITEGEVWYKGQRLDQSSAEELNKIRGKELAMIFQEPMTSLNPVFTIGNQMIEMMRLHLKISKKEAKQRAIELLEQVGIPRANEVVNQYPHQLSGGMRQRVMIAMAISCEPSLLIADEPTTALDVTVQAQILDLLKQVQEKNDMGIIFISHDLGVIAEICDSVAVMYAGEIVERAPVEELFREPKHPYTQLLLKAIPKLDDNNKKLETIKGTVPSLTELTREGCSFANRCPFAMPECQNVSLKTIYLNEKHRISCHLFDEEVMKGKGCRNMSKDTILEVNDLKQYYPIRGGVFQRKVGEVKAVDGVSFKIKKGETVGLVGESGCGKSSAGRTILRLQNATAGEIKFCGQDITKAKGKTLREARKGFQMVFQDPYASLNPMQMVGDIVGEPIRNYYKKKQKDIKDEVIELLERVGLDESAYYKYAHEFSGGQRQRVGIARALALKPKLIIADEPVSALDVSVQSQVLNIMDELQEEFGLSYLFIAHDLSVVKHVSDYICVMYLGHIVEQGPAEEIYRNPQHPYTQSLISAIPEIDPAKRRERVILQGDLPSPSNPPKGCPFHTRCPLVTEECKQAPPEYRKISDGHVAACIHLKDEVKKV